mgnify:CR=1 FL=1
MIKKLFIRAFILLIPLLMTGGYFLISDPMKVVYEYCSPLKAGVLMNDRLFQIRWLNKHEQDYNSFVFGSSRSKAFKTPEWKQNLPDGSLPFHMGVNDESLFGVVKKLQYLDQKGYSIDHVIFIMDHRLLSLLKNSDVHIFRDYYEITGESYGAYYKRFFTSFLNVSFLSHYFNYKISGKIEKDNIYLWDSGFTYDKTTGDHYYERMDSLIRYDSINYYQEQKEKVFYERKPMESVDLIGGQAEQFLHEIKAVLSRHNSDYQLIITPNYDQVQLSGNDRLKLESIFTSDKILDVSGVNDMTSDYRNYYEHKHFKPYIASQLMKQVYFQP